jgi:hyperosmotically inducible protein
VNLKHITVLSVCALILAGCNKTPSDQEAAGQSTPANTGQGSSSASATADRSATASNPQTSTSAAGSALTNSTTPATPPPLDAAAKPADNTGRNVRDRSSDTVTPGDQSEAKGDLEVTRRIRRAITQNDQLTTTAKNIKIVTANGKVTLRGPVQNAAEKQQIADLVKATEGVTSVDDQLEVKTNQ